jgi:hypothetical protein
MNFNNTESAAPAPATAPAKAATTPAWSDLEDDVAVAETAFTPPPAAPAADKPSSQRAEDILAMIRNRQK